MKHLLATMHAVIGLLAGILLGTWLLMLCFGPLGVLYPILEKFDRATLDWLEAALPRTPLAFAMLGLGLLLARWVWRHAPPWRCMVVTATLLSGIPSVMFILLVIAAAGSVPNFGYGG
jgi:hypothetical protein